MNFSHFLPNKKGVVQTLTIMLIPLLFSACANLSQLEKESLTEIEKLEKQFENNQANALFHIKLGSEYEKLGKAKSSKFYYKKAIVEYKKALELEPSNSSLMFSLYQLSYLGVAEWFAEIDELSVLYNKIDSKLRKSLNPPHLALFQRESARATYGAVTDQKLTDILYKALAENPQNGRVSYLLSIFLVEEERYIMAIDLLKRALAAQPENPFLTMQLGIAYEAFANWDYCPYEHENELKKSLTLLQEAAKQIPNNLYLNHTLATLYERFNVSVLMVDSAKKMVAEDTADRSKFTLAEALSNAGQLSKAEEIYDELINKGMTNAYINKAMVYAENGDWEHSYASTKKYLERHQSLSIYSALLFLAMEEILSLEPTPLSDMSAYVNVGELDTWEKALFDYWYGAKSEKELINLATNICKKAESDFLIGVRKLKTQDKQIAKSYFEQVVNSEAYSFVEYRVAGHLIKMIDN